MFGRRKRKPIHRRVGHFFWPNRGWKRAGTYALHRLGRLPGTPYSIAAGFACGVAVSFTPFVGLHSVAAILIALLIGGNILAAFVGTLVGNPWTFPFMWLASHRVGEWILGFRGPSEARLTVAFNQILYTLWEDPVGAVQALWPVIWPTAVGAVPLGIAVWFAVFYPVRRLIARYQQARLQRRQAQRQSPLQNSMADK